ncbi:vesicle transport protein sft2b [Quercus suber]|uniref:Vesicle transport protein n=1 Tax=Quercus suber TaxID=58331 RepID=A0AAW0KLV3_QUESU
MEKMNQALEKMKMIVGMERFYGFAICFVAGLTCTLLSMLVFFNPIKFGMTFTMGNLLALGSTAFLIGPKRQVTMMLDPVRIYATALYLASMIIALFCALYSKELASLKNPRPPTPPHPQPTAQPKPKGEKKQEVQQ